MSRPVGLTAWYAAERDADLGEEMNERSGKSPRTPTTEEIRSGYANHFETVQETLVHRFWDAGEGEAEFDRWLTAHDDEVRQEQADHDAIRINDLDTRLVTAERELSEVRAGFVAEEPEWRREERYRRPVGAEERKVTPWVPVKQEGDPDD